MKKILFSILAVAAVSASCTKFAEEAVIDFKEIAAPEVTATTVADDQIEVKVNGKEGTCFFSYIVTKGAAKAIDAETLLKGKYASAAVKYGDGTAAAVLDYTKVQSVSLSIEKLSSNTPYTIYAVATNAQGVVSEIATATTTTTDETAPAIVEYDYEETEDGSLVFDILFDDPVVLGATGDATAYFYGVYTTPDAEGNLVATKTVTVAHETLAASGKSLLVTIPAEEYTPGAIVAITYPEGIVTNALGAKCAAFSYAKVPANLQEVQSLAAQYENVTFKFSVNENGDGEDDKIGEGTDEEDGPVIFTDWKKLKMTAYAQGDYPLADYGEDAALTIKVVDGNGRTVTYSGQQFEIVDDKTIAAALDENPGYGVSISYTYVAGTFVDIYGNESEEFTVNDGYYCSYGYTVDDVIGTYSVTSSNAYTGETSPEYTLIVEDSENKEKGNIVITNYLGIEGKIYATLNFDNGQFSIKAGKLFAGTAESGYATYFYKDNEAVFNVPAAGKIVCSDYYVGAATVTGGETSGNATDAEGNMLLLYDFVATRK